MEEIEELRKKLQCEKCHKPHKETNPLWVHVKCKHHACADCCRLTPPSKCPICACSTTYTLIPFMEDILNTLDGYESSIVKNNESEVALRENSVLKEKLSKLKTPKEDHQKCAECEKSESEQDMQLCQTCHGLKFKNHEDVKSHALCAPCAIRNHMRKGHHTVDFYPYLSAYNFSSQSTNINSKSEQYKNARDLLNGTLTRFNAASINVLENYDILTDMARRSKSTKNQVEFLEKMKKFMDESKSINLETEFEVKKRTTKLEDNLAKIKKWYKSKMGNCLDESEIIKLANSKDSEKNDT